jgi:hypothetical protein
MNLVSSTLNLCRSRATDFGLSTRKPRRPRAGCRFAGPGYNLISITEPDAYQLVPRPARRRAQAIGIIVMDEKKKDYVVIFSS